MKKHLSLLIVFILMFSIIAAASASAGSDTLATDYTITRAYRAISDANYYPDGYIGYRYPIRPGTAQWAALDNHQHMVDACEIPEDALSAMTTAELAQTILSYPLIADIFAYDDWSKGAAVVSAHFNALSAFSKNPDSASALVALYVNQTPDLKAVLEEHDNIEMDATSTDIGYKAYHQVLRTMVLSVLLTQDEYFEKLTSLEKNAFFGSLSERIELFHSGKVYMPEAALIPELSILENRGAITASAVAWVRRTGYFHYTKSNSTVRTPKNSSVTVDNKVCVEVWLATDGKEYIRPEFQSADLPASYITTLNRTYYDVYGINPVRNPTVKYNCHSYAWYNKAASNGYWMNNPSKYLSDGSYTEVSKLQTSVGDRMVYYSSNTDTYSGISHSAVIKSYVDDTHSKRTFIVTSKWGMLGLYDHSWANCPYYYVNQFPCDLRYFH